MFTFTDCRIIDSHFSGLMHIYDLMLHARSVLVKDRLQTVKKFDNV